MATRQNTLFVMEVIIRLFRSTSYDSVSMSTSDTWSWKIQLSVYSSSVFINKRDKRNISRYVSVMSTRRYPIQTSSVGYQRQTFITAELFATQHNFTVKLTP